MGGGVFGLVNKLGDIIDPIVGALLEINIISGCMISCKL